MDSSIDEERLEYFLACQAAIDFSQEDEPAPALFFYGTLMVPNVLYRVIYGTPEPDQKSTCNILARPALLHNYERRRVQYADYPGIVPKEGSEVRGTYVEGLTKANLRCLDIFEGSDYKLQQVTAKVMNRLNGKETWDEKPVHTYVFLPEDCLEDYEWSFQDFIKEKAYAWMGISKGKNLVTSDVDPQLGWYKDPAQNQAIGIHTQAN